MKIIQPGAIEFTDVTYTGECGMCGCVFETEIGVSQGRKGTLYQNKDNLMAFEVDRTRGSLSCICPSCVRYRVALKRK